MFAQIIDNYGNEINEVVEKSDAYLVQVYVVYSVLAMLLVGWLAITLFRNGAHFLDVVFRDNKALARAVNRLLVTGFIMFSLGFASLTVAGGNALDAAEAFETCTRKFGVLLIVLAFAHLFNMLVLNNMRKTAERKNTADDKLNTKKQYEDALNQYHAILAQQSGATKNPGWDIPTE